MRGTVKWQTAQLTKAIFEERLSKEQRTDPNDEAYGKIASYGSMETYRDIWDDFATFLKETYGIKDLEQATGSHAAAFIEGKIAKGASKQYAEKLVSALGALERALRRYTRNKYLIAKTYDFSARLDVLHEAKNLGKLRDGYHDRAYLTPYSVIEHMEHPDHRLAAAMTIEGGPRLEGTALIKPGQLRGLAHDKFTGQLRGVVFTKEKGGKGGDVMISPETYVRLERRIGEHGVFEVYQRDYQKDVRQAALATGENPEGTHGFRWNFAQYRLEELQEAGLTYDQALQQVSWEMKHERASITHHYVGRPS